MEAAIFFRVIKHGRKIYNRERYLFLYDLADVGIISVHPDKNYESVKNHFKEKAFPEMAKAKVFPSEDPNTFHLVMSALSPLKKVAHVRQ